MLWSPTPEGEVSTSNGGFEPPAEGDEHVDTPAEPVLDEGEMSSRSRSRPVRS